jgi:moderate conductance mechanosensitive channel
MTLENLPSKILASSLAIVLAALGLIVLQFIGRWANKIVRSIGDLHEERRQQLLTIIHALRWVIGVLVVIAASLMALSNFVDIAPLLAGAGLAGLAVSLGAQTLIGDLIGGVLILVENQ